MFKTCVACGRDYDPRSNRQIYCSKTCRLGERDCVHCGKTFVPGRHGEERRFCSLACWYDSQCPVGSVRPDNSGYNIVKVPPGTPGTKRAARGRNHWMWEHRYVMQQHIGRPIEPWEQVHHKNGRRDDNRIENLELWRHQQPSGIREGDYHCPGCVCQK
jgi:hypothetical protein